MAWSRTESVGTTVHVRTRASGATAKRTRTRGSSAFRRPEARPGHRVARLVAAGTDRKSEARARGRRVRDSSTPRTPRTPRTSTTSSERPRRTAESSPRHSGSSAPTFKASEGEQHQGRGPRRTGHEPGWVRATSRPWARAPAPRVTHPRRMRRNERGGCLEGDRLRRNGAHTEPCALSDRRFHPELPCRSSPVG